MKELNLVYDDSNISWYCNESKVELSCGEIEFAAEVDGKIYIESFNNNDEYECWYYDLNGKLIIAYIADANIIKSRLPNDEIILIDVPNLQAVSFDGQLLIYALVENKGDNELLVFSNSGEIIYKYLPPENYTFYRFNSVGKDIAIICQGNEITEDVYGRNDWQFKIDLPTGKWTKISLSY